MLALALTPPPPPSPRAGTWALSALVPGLCCLLLTPALMYVLYPPEMKDTPDAPMKVSWAGGRVGGGGPCAGHAPAPQRALLHVWGAPLAGSGGRQTLA